MNISSLMPIEKASVADPAAVVLGPHVRFTVLSERLLRLEYSCSDAFEDHPSQGFWYRHLPVVSYQSRQDTRFIEIETAYLVLRYRITDQGFSPATLSVLVKATGANWYYGDWPGRGQNLWGTARTLDGASGAVHLEPGLIGRRGWAVVDDSQSLVFDDLVANRPGWLQTRQNPENIDLYFFGFGHDYRACLQEFSQVAGSAPLIPRWVLGNWWSRYWVYSQDELLQLMEEFKEHQVPLSVCIVDMDWHITETGNRSTGWTGYTWNRKLFPDPGKLINRLHAMGLRTALNLHPADGVYPHEEQYAEFARFMGLDPAERQPILFDCTDRIFMQAYFRILHHPYEELGVDFWWLDWQQGVHSKIPGLDPLWWLNHLHFYNLGRDGIKRPFIFSRWGGLGHHRYPIGFSGDTEVGWEALSNLPGFTATAANVGYGWWSHDIGGHMGGIEDDELYTRWVQYGVFSPILRLHSTNNPYHERRPWGRGPVAAALAGAAMRLRHALIPYIYSMAWRHYTTAQPLVTPVYYTHPENPQAYIVPQEYWFGSELLAAPYTSPAHPETGLSRQSVWLPSGEWFNFFSGEHIQGDGWHIIYGLLPDIPIFAKAGAIIPLGPLVGWGGVDIPQSLHLVVFPGADNRFELVEDDGATTGYLEGKYTVTLFSQKWRENELVFTLHPARGDLTLIPDRRSIVIELRGIVRPDQVAVCLNSLAVEIAWTYDQVSDCLTFSPVILTPSDELTVSLQTGLDSLISHRDRHIGTLRKFLRSFRLDSWVKARIDREWSDVVSGSKPLRSYAALSDAQIAVLDSLLGGSAEYNKC